MNAKVLVTGGAGYIGSHTCKRLARSGYDPVVLDNMVYGHPWAVKWGDAVRGDILDAPLLDALFATHRPEAVVHFAAYAYVGESVADPGKYYRNNVAGTLSLLEAMRRNGCRKIVFSSTCATFGMPAAIPIAENAPQNPINPYGRGKLMIEQILKDYEDAYGIRNVVLRYFNAAGADGEGEIGECHDPETHLIPLAIFAAMEKGPPLEIFGGDYPTPDGTAIRDYVHVSDLADAHVRALQLPATETGGRGFNLGTGRGHSVLEVIAAVERVGGRKVPVLRGPRRPGDPAELVAGSALAGEKLGWAPEFADIETIVASAWRWHRSSPV